MPTLTGQDGHFYIEDGPTKRPHHIFKGFGLLGAPNSFVVLGSPGRNEKELLFNYYFIFPHSPLDGSVPITSLGEK